MHVVCADSTCVWSRKTFSFQDTVVCAPTMIIVAIRISNTVFTTTPIGTNAKKSYGVELAATRTIFSPITNAGLFAKPSDNPRICTPGVNFLILKNWFSPNKKFFFLQFSHCKLHVSRFYNCFLCGFRNHQLSCRYQSLLHCLL